MARKLEQPYIIFYDTNGLPLNNGKIYFGVANTNAETNPIVVYWDKAQTLVANQPINTLNGYPVRNGIISKLYINLDSYSYTIRDKNNAIVDTRLQEVSDNFSRNGDTGSGAFTFDSTSTFGTANQVYPIKFIHSNVFSNLDPYGSGSVIFDCTGQDNNQPVAVFRNKRASGSLGNGALAIFQNTGGAGVTSTSDIQADIEIISNNALVSTYNGKAEIHTTCGRTTGTAIYRDGSLDICLRRTPLNPSGANTGFDPIFKFLPASTVGLGLFDTLGAGFNMVAQYDYLAFSRGDITSAYNDVRFKAESTFSGGDAYLDLFSGSAGSATIGGHYRLLASGADNRLSLRNMSAGGITAWEVLPADVANRGITAFYNYLDTTKGAIRLGNATNGMIIEGDNGTYNFDSTGVTNITTDSLYHVSSRQILKVNLTIAVAGTVTTNLAPLATDELVYIHVVSIGAGGVYKINFPAIMTNTQTFKIVADANIAALTLTALEVGGTIMDAPTSLTANQAIIFQYYSTDKILIRLK